jgi:hypothetical protein
VFGQQEPPLTSSDVERYRREQSIINFLNINMSKHLIVEVINGTVTDRVAPLMDVYYNDEGRAEYVVYYNEKGKSERYTLYQYDDGSNKIEEIRFNADSTLINGILFSYDSNNCLLKQLNYDFNGKVIAEYEFKRENDSVIKQVVIGQDKSVVSHRIYTYRPPIDDGIILSMVSVDNKGNLLDSVHYSYNTENRVEEKEMFSWYDNAKHEITEYVYNPDGALIKYIISSGKNESITSIEYDEYGNIVAFITSDENENITKYIKIDHFTLTTK